MSKGKRRVIIENIQPQVDQGLYYAKRTVGERVNISADLFADGHDHIRAQVHYKMQDSGSWIKIEMKATGNDRWETHFYTTQKSVWTFKIVAWIDHFDTWYDGFKKKVEAKVEVKTEILEGVDFLKRISGSAEKKLLDLAEKLKNDRYEDAVKRVLSEEFSAIVHEHPDIQHETVSEPELKILVEHVKANFSAWYELFPRSASLQKGTHGTFQDCIKLLPRIAAMGFDVLYFPPIHPIGKINRKGKNNNVNSTKDEPGSPWAIGSDEGGHKSIHPGLGTLEDYKVLIREARKYSIDIALDLAFQCAPDHPYVKEHPDWFKQRPDGSIQYAENPPKKYQDIYPFNFECDDWQGLWNELKSVIVYWIEQGVKIFRVDNPHTKPMAFWQWAIAEVNKDYPDIIFLSEAFTRPKIMSSLAKGGFTQSYTYFSWRTSKQELTEYMHELVHSPSRNYFRPNFWPTTPDILPFHLQHQGENSFIQRLALACTLSSNYGIYGPTYEFCENNPIPGKEEFFDSEKYEIKHYDWKRTNRLTDIITMLNKARKSHVALQSTWNIQFLTIENPNLIAYLKSTDDLSDIVLVVVNLDPQSRQSGYVQLPLNTLKLTGRINVKLHDLPTGEKYTWAQEWNFVEIDPYKMPFHLFVLEVHESFM